MQNAVEVESDGRKDDLFTLDEVLMLEVLYSGIYKSVCLRFFGSSLKGPTRTRWPEHVWDCAIGHRFVSVTDSIGFISPPPPPPFLLLFSACRQKERDCQFNIDFNSIK